MGVLFALYGEPAFQRHELAPLRSFSPQEQAILHAMLAKGILSPQTTSIGRLFDAVAAIIGLCLISDFEGQAAMALEGALPGTVTDAAYEFPLRLSPSSALLDWAPLIENIMRDVGEGVSTGLMAAKFHNALLEAIVAVARHAGTECVALSGGCFQNRRLTEGAVTRLQAAGFRPYWHRRVPPNDGGLALGQLAAACQPKVWKHVSGDPW